MTHGHVTPCRGQVLIRGCKIRLTYKLFRKNMDENGFGTYVGLPHFIFLFLFLNAIVCITYHSKPNFLNNSMPEQSFLSKNIQNQRFLPQKNLKTQSLETCDHFLRK